MNVPFGRNIAKILYHRAEAVAAPLDPDAGHVMEEFGIFSVGEQWLGVPLASFRHVFAVAGLTPIPRGPAGFLGVCYAEGAVHTLLHTGEFLNLRNVRSKDLNYAVVVGLGSRSIALGVQELLAIEDVRASEIHPIVHECPYLNRVIGNVLILDPAGLFEDPRLHGQALRA